MSYWDERNARREGARDADRSHFPSRDYDRHGDDTGRAYHRAFEDRRDEIRQEELREECRQEERAEQSRREARAADMAMEEYRRQQDEAAYGEPEPEEEPEPIVAAAMEVFAEMDNDCRNALREV